MSLRSAVALLALVVMKGAAADAPLPYQGTNQHLGVATCVTSVCHGSVTASSTQNVRLDEFVTWSHQDKHSQAYAALTTEKARTIAAKLGIADARTDRMCLDCHSDNVPPERRGREFTLTDGVSCEACHGGAGPWITTHSARNGTYRGDVAHGMYPTADLPQRLNLCLSCHYGNADKFVTHRIMGAGHPRLSFELDTFLALQPPHYDQDADYAKRKPTYPRAQLWASGQLALARRQMELLNGPLLKSSSLVPELSLFDCHACHENPMHRLDWSRGSLTHLTAPGQLTFPINHLEMALTIARRVAPGEADAMLATTQSLEQAAGQNRERVSSVAANLARVLDRVASANQEHRWTSADAGVLLENVVRLGSSGELKTYSSAEQAVMAIDVLCRDLGVLDRYRGEVDALYRTVKDEDAYNPAQLSAQLTELDARLRSSPPQ
jgi:Cytochrome c554 and c-prime